MPFNTPLPEEETDTKSRSVAQRSHSASASSWTIRRVTYTLGGQTIAQRVMGTDDDGVFYVHQDHLGSASIMSDSAGQVMEETKTTFYPFGSYRHQAAAKLSDRGFTGHQHDDGVGLIYMNARFYVPSIGRFASADTIVPDPLNPQSLNRFSYVQNNPVRYTDPSGHCVVDDQGCINLAAQLNEEYQQF